MPAFSSSMPLLSVLEASVVDSPDVVSPDLRVGSAVGDTFVLKFGISLFPSIWALVAAWTIDATRGFLESMLGIRFFVKQFFDISADREGGEQNAATPSIFGPTTPVIHKNNREDGNTTSTILTVERIDGFPVGRYGAEQSRIV